MKYLIISLIICLSIGFSQPVDSTPIWRHVVPEHESFAPRFQISNTFYYSITTSDSLTTGLMMLNATTGDSIGFITYPSSSFSFNHNPVGEDDYIFQYNHIIDGDYTRQFGIWNLSSNSITVDSIPMIPKFDFNISSGTITRRPNVLPLNDNKVLITRKTPYWGYTPWVHAGNSRTYSYNKAYTNIQVYDYENDVFTLDTIVDRYFEYIQTDTTGRFLAYTYKTSPVWNDIDFEMDEVVDEERLFFYDTKTNQTVVDTALWGYTNYGSRVFALNKFHLSKDGGYIISSTQNGRRLNIHKLLGNEFKNSWFNERNPHNSYWSINSLFWNSSSDKVILEEYHGWGDDENSLAVFDINSQSFIKRFEFEYMNFYERGIMDDIILHWGFDQNGNNNDTLIAYSLTSIPSSVAPPIDEDLFEDLLNSNKSFKVFDKNGNELLKDELNNRIKYQKLKSGRYFIQTEEKTYKIIKN